ncbi:20864_t:CDS:2 [Gigaspora rosea]|nr:20864_t:CDS:2 [Gigaspora rosea]
MESYACINFININLTSLPLSKLVSEIIKENISGTFVNELETYMTKPGRKKKTAHSHAAKRIYSVLQKQAAIEIKTPEPEKQETEHVVSKQKDLIEVDQPIICEPVIELVVKQVIEFEQITDPGYSFCGDMNSIASLGTEQMINDYMLQFLFANWYSPPVF